MENQNSAAASVQQSVQQLVDAGDVSAAATAALRALGPEILRFLRSVLRDEEDAADAFSHFAERLWRGLSSFEGRSSLRTWAFRIAWNSALSIRNDAWHRRGRRFATGEASALAEEIRTKTVVRVERRRDAFEKLRRALSAEDQSLLALRLDRGFSWEEVAEIMSAGGEPVQALTLMKRFERIKKRLAEMVKKQALDE
ncbi:RNA polymerase sigma factor [Anaeromyxobacter sp. Fw109-5]|uniref:RNA polymerase sigma factor n=1 Tax=Anaeromyxobacter sp. (strain Fw109-5) TaxID=404589 RepID=UPI000158A586|nr:sigma-70 family RNA polymerase sigma factor [Anaeromyxobacter sp. Fw109-5]ABS27313.1 RNA polymerase, sigma-24 subunit, ECF subfamily [Anaeromyxobacter sp. Fw109-5]